MVTSQEEKDLGPDGKAMVNLKLSAPAAMVRPSKPSAAVR
jgi:hypothetical protein